MRVARCRSQPTDVPPPSQAGPEQGKRRAGTPNRPPPVSSDVLRALGEVLEEVELLGGGNVAAITNEPALAALLEVNYLNSGAFVACNPEVNLQLVGVTRATDVTLLSRRIWWRFLSRAIRIYTLGLLSLRRRLMLVFFD